MHKRKHRHHFKIVGRTNPLTFISYTDLLFFQCDNGDCVQVCRMYAPTSKVLPS